MAHTRNQTIAVSLSKLLSLDPECFSGEVEKCDVKSLCVNILKRTQSGSSILTNDEAMKWIVFADSFPEDLRACTGALRDLNDALVKKSVLLGEGFKLSEVDVIVYSSIHPCIIATSKSDWQKFPNVLRWMDYVQSKEDFGGILERVPVEKARYEPSFLIHKANTEMAPNSNLKDSAEGVKADKKGKDVKNSKTANGPEADKASKKDSAVPSTKAKSAEAAAEVKKPAKEAAAKDEVPVTLLNIQVGFIRKAWKHPSADSLLVEEIDVGEPKVRQVVSGLAKYCSPDDLMNRRVVLITNVKPGKLRDVVSEGLVLCASNEDHSVIEPLLPPQGAVIGERVSFSGHEGKPEDVLNPKKKQFDKITPHLYTDDNGVAMYKGIPFMTSGGPCTSSITKASIK